MTAVEYLATGDERPRFTELINGEVRSPSTWRFDVGTKKDTYERAGLPELWLVDTVADKILVFRRSERSSRLFDVAVEVGSGDVLESPLLPGFQLDVRRLFDR